MSVCVRERERVGACANCPLQAVFGSVEHSTLGVVHVRRVRVVSARIVSERECVRDSVCACVSE